MKGLKQFVLLILAVLLAQSASAETTQFKDLLEKQTLVEKAKEVIAEQDINFGVNLGNIDLIDGINLSAKYSYGVDSSYISQYYTRIDKWDLHGGINVGEVLKDSVNLPFSFSINRENSFFFVRQFPTKKHALLAIPYTPQKLPLTANLALKNLNIGDFVSMPANLSVGVSLSTSSSYALPVIVNANASVYGVISGEFTIQVFKVDQTHVRLKLISQRSRTTGANVGSGFRFNFFGISLLDGQVKRLVDSDLISMGVSFTPQSQFILDYVFDLSDSSAQEAYNQIISSTYKFKDTLVTEQIFDPSDLKDKLISSYEKADQLTEQDRSVAPEHRRVQRIFKGFNVSAGHSKNLKLAFLFTSYKKDTTFSESKVTFIDKNERNLEFFYPTYSKYTETHLGQKWFFDLKDQSSITNFGLIPRFDLENQKVKYPDLGLTYERRDIYFSSFEQKAVEKFLLSQIPTNMLVNADLGEWRNGLKKKDSRIFLQLILKAQGFAYLKNISEEEMIEKILKYAEEKSQSHVIEQTQDDKNVEAIKNFLFINHFIKKGRLISLAKSLTKILKNEENDAELMLKRLVALNEFGLFDRIGVGFLISLLPQDRLEDLVYLKLQMDSKDVAPVNIEAGKLNYRALYNELTTIQSRLSNRSYDLRISEADRDMEDLDITGMKEVITKEFSQPEDK